MFQISLNFIYSIFSVNTFTQMGDAEVIKASPIEVANEVLVFDEPVRTSASTPTEQSHDSCKRKDLVSLNYLNKLIIIIQALHIFFYIDINVDFQNIKCRVCPTIFRFQFKHQSSIL